MDKPNSITAPPRKPSGRFRRRRNQRYLSEKRKLEPKKKQKIKKESRRQKKSSNSSVSRTRQDISFKSNIDIYGDENRKRLIWQCNKIRDSESPHIHLDFNEGGMSGISAAGMLLLYAEIYRKITENVKITCNYPSIRQAEQVLQHIGFFNLIKKPLRIPPEEIDKANENIRSWHVIKDTRFNGEEISEFLEKIVENSSKQKTSKIYVAILELISNAADHAYKKDDIMKHWVVFGSQKDEDLVLVVGDLGRTIPVAIKENDAWMKIQERIQNIIPSKSGRILRKLVKIFSPRDDSSLIDQAIKLGESGTREAHRGKGFHDVNKIKDIDGSITVYSRKGHVSVWSGENHKKPPIPSIAGTIIEMSIPVKSIR